MTAETVPATAETFEPTKACLDGWDTYADTPEALEKVLTNGGHVGSCTAEELGLPAAPGEPGYEEPQIVLAGTGHVPEAVAPVPVVGVASPATELPVTGTSEIVQSGLAAALILCGVLLARLSRRGDPGDAHFGG